MLKVHCCPGYQGSSVRSILPPTHPGTKDNIFSPKLICCAKTTGHLLQKFKKQYRGRWEVANLYKRKGNRKVGSIEYSTPDWDVESSRFNSGIYFTALSSSNVVVFVVVV
jgi:hypothetical protein